MLSSNSDPFLESPETFRAQNFKTKASRSTKLYIYFSSYSLYNIRKDQLYRILRMAFRAQKVVGTLEKRASDLFALIVTSSCHDP